MDKSYKTVREHIPLEQGLRLEEEIVSFNRTHQVREHIPLEQGLRLCSPWVLVRKTTPSESIFH